MQIPYKPGIVAGQSSAVHGCFDYGRVAGVVIITSSHNHTPRIIGSLWRETTGHRKCIDILYKWIPNNCVVDHDILFISEKFPT